MRYLKEAHSQKISAFRLLFIIFIFGFFGSCAGFNDGSGKKLYSEKKYNEALPLLIEEANGGDAEAQDYVGVIYAYQVNPKNFSESIFWLSKSAEQGYVQGQYDLGQVYYINDNPNYKKSVYWLEKAAIQNNINAKQLLSAIYLEPGEFYNPERAAYWYENLALENDVYSQYCLGKMYYEGTGVGRDYTKALYWLDKAGSGGNAEALYVLGTMYRDGIGVVPDNHKSYFYFEKSASLGDEKSFNALKAMQCKN